MRVRSIGITLLLALLASPAYAMDLQQAWQAAQTKDPQFSAARAGAAAGQFKIDQARALKLPQINAMAGTGVVNAYNKISNAQFSAPGLGAASGANFITQTNSGADLRWNISAEQPLYNAERNSMAQQLQKQAQLAEAQFSSEEQLLILRVAKAYFDQLLAADTLASVQQQRKAVAQALAVAQGRFKEGDVAIIDTHEAQARDDALLSQALEAASDYQLALAALFDLTGNAEQPLARLPEQVNLQQLTVGELSDWLALAQSHSPYLHMQQLRQGIAHDEIDKHRALTAPILNLVAQAGGAQLRGLGSSYASELNNHSVSLGVQLTIPLYSGGMRTAKYAEAVALDTQAQDETELMRLRAGQEARVAWLGVTVGQSKVKALEQALHSAQVKLDATELGREVGDRTTLDVLNAEQAYYATRTSLLGARYQLLLSFLSLAATAGNLDESRLLAVNKLLAAAE